MRPGALDKIVAIVGDVEVDDGGGGSRSTVTVILADEPAAITQLAAAERLRGAGQAAEATHRLTLWYRPEVTVAMRAIYADPHAGRTRTFEIVTVRNVDERGVELELEAIERVS
jgi:head-tail adaptor